MSFFINVRGLIPCGPSLVFLAFLISESACNLLFFKYEALRFFCSPFLYISVIIALVPCLQYPQLHRMCVILSFSNPAVFTKVDENEGESLNFTILPPEALITFTL